jgi:RHS repeat-associated protein
VTDALSHTTTYGYDFYGNLTGITDARSQTTAMGYDGQGRVTSVTDPLTHATTMTYQWGDQATVTDALSRTTNMFADALGRVSAVRDPLGNRTLTSYDVRDRPTVITDPLGGTVQMGYDANNNLVSFRDQRNNLTEFTYDTMNRLKTRKDALLRTETYDYDIAGRLKQVTDRKSQVSGFGYDALNRRTSAGFGATTGNPTAFTSTIAYTWDAGNRLTQAVDSVAGAITRQYDTRFDTLTQEVTPEGQVDLTYDAAARRATFQVAGQTQLGYTFDAADRLTQIAQGATTVGFGYDNANRRTTLTLPNGIVVEYGYDNANQLTGLTYKNGGTTLGALTYSYDNAGRRTQVAGSYARTNLPAALASATYNANNQLINWGGTTLTYDNNGNLLTDGTNTHTWNARDQLASISGGVTASFGYDAFNRRRTKTIAGTKTDFLYDGLNFVQEKDGATIKANLLTGLGIDEVFRRTQGAVTSDVLPDALGSSLALSDSTKAITTQYTYAPYGATTQTGPANDNSQRFTGREDDGTTGLYYYRARYYSTPYSRFVSEDPIDFGGGPNVYAYVGGNPLFFIDPFGQELIDPSFSPGTKYWYNAPWPRTIPLSRETSDKMDCVLKCLGKKRPTACMVTGGQEREGHRGPGHPEKRAVDIAGPIVNRDLTTPAVLDCAFQCGFTHGWWENKHDPRKDHWHIQAGPGGNVPPIIPSWTGL